MIMFSFLTQTVSMHFDGLFDYWKGHFNRQLLKAVVRSQVILYLKGKYRIDRIDVEGGGRGSTLNISLTLSINKLISDDPL